MTRRFSFYGLLATAIAIGVLFYRVIEPFIFALLFALVLAVLLKPVHERLTRRWNGHQRLAAWAITAAFGIAVIVPLAVAMVLAGIEIQKFARDMVALMKPASIAAAEEAPQPAGDFNEADADPPSAELLNPEAIEAALEDDQVKRSVVAQWLTEQYAKLPDERRKIVVENFSQAMLRFVEDLYRNTMRVVSSVAGFFIGVVVISMALYYALADGAAILADIKKMLPFEEHEVQELAEQFGKVCRGVVLGTVVAALAQAALALIGFTVAGVPNLLPLFVMTILFAFIPMVGAGSAVTLVSAYLALDGRYLAAGLLLAYGLGVVSTCDNFIRAYVIGTEAKMNPLLVLITAIGALQLIGLWGIFVGPMVAAFFYTIMKLLRERLDRESNKPATTVA
jgi:predicted PurR-regulated permease PerM